MYTIKLGQCLLYGRNLFFQKIKCNKHLIRFTKNYCVTSCNTVRFQVLVMVRCLWPNNGGSEHLWNISKLLSDYMVQQSIFIFIFVM
jgi:hypothetical protein